METFHQIESQATLQSAVEARHRAPARRALAPVAKLPPEIEPIELSGIRLEPGSNALQVRGRHVVLRAKPVAVLALLMNNAGRPVSRQTLISTIWGTYRPRHDAALRVYVHGLRRLIDSDPRVERRILTVRAPDSRGYLFRP
jgi:two-component system KDP operon response regulator KdpE